MKIAILLPYKEDYTSKYSGAVSIHVSNLYKYSKYKNNIEIFGNTNFKSYLTKNFKNITIKENILSSSNKKYLNKFIEDQKKNLSDININIATDSTQRVQEMHILVGHILCDIVEHSF